MARVAGVKAGGRLVVAQPSEGEPVPKEVLATTIIKASEAMVALHKSGLNREAIVVLLSDKTKISKGWIREILDGLENLKKDYCRA